MKKITVYVTKSDIAKGRRRDPWCCPVAQAVRRRTGAGGEERAVSVGELSIRVCGVTYNTPEKVILFIRRFDEQKSVKPFRFTLVAFK